MHKGMIGAFVALVATATQAGAQDIEAGKAVFRKCMPCHATDTTTNKVGPHLGDVMGRIAGTVDGYVFSKAMKEAGAAGLVWDEAALADYLIAPKAKVPGTKMAFAGLKKPQDITDVIAYLKTLPE